jgi:outer membrane receptor protein involved in Fe transport
MSKSATRGNERAAIRLKPLALGVRTALLTKRHAPLVATTLLASTMAFGQAGNSGELEEIVVTAQKREQNLQAVPISVNVLDQQLLQDQNIKGFSDYVLLLPNVSSQSYGPGQSQIFMRGCSDGGDGNFSGTNPSTAMYLDEQPVTAIGRNLDVQIYDVARIEALGGPQGTLYGSSSQCGTIRIITNKPNSDGFEGGYDLGVNSVDDGDTGYSAKGFVNFPLSDNAAIRLVGWFEEEGGWIDSVPGTATFSRSGITVQNSGNADSRFNTVEDDYNTTTNTGARAMLGIDLNDNWTLNASVMAQTQESDRRSTIWCRFARRAGYLGRPGQSRSLCTGRLRRPVDAVRADTGRRHRRLGNPYSSRFIS